MPFKDNMHYMTVTILALLQRHMPSLPKAELRVARALRDDYPSAGFETIARLAATAEVSGPTVLRLIERLGFDSYPEFQAALRSELSMRTKSPLDLYAEAETDLDPFQRAQRQLMNSVQRTFALLDPAEVSRAADLLADTRRPLFSTAGRFTALIARSLTLHLDVLRPGVTFLSPEDRISKVLDFTAKDVVVVVDLRRYQASTERFARETKLRKSTVILITDEWMSPITAVADVILKVALEAPSPFDSLVGAESLVETLVAAVVDRLGTDPHDRMSMYDHLWRATDIEDRSAPSDATAETTEDL